MEGKNESTFQKMSAEISYLLQNYRSPFRFDCINRSDAKPSTRFCLSPIIPKSTSQIIDIRSDSGFTKHYTLPNMNSSNKND